MKEIKGLYETHLKVTDVERATHFYSKVLGLQECYRDYNPLRIFYWVGEAGNYMLGIWETAPEEFKPSHISFRMDPSDFQASINHLKEHEVYIYNFRKDGTKEPAVFGWMPAVSIYFLDPDGNPLEFISMLNDSPRPELGTPLWSEWERIHQRASPMS